MLLDSIGAELCSPPTGARRMKCWALSEGARAQTAVFESLAIAIDVDPS